MNNIALVVMKPNLRPIFFWHHSAEANYLLRTKQFEFGKNDISIAKILINNKIKNQYQLLVNTRQKSALMENAKQICLDAISSIPNITSYKDLMGVEGYVAKNYFKAYFDKIGWNCRMPRAKIDAINTTLDIGYTILFNFIEVFARMFGFDVYIGVYHRLWFKRKSLICDLVEPFRCIIDAQVRKSFHSGQFKENDFNIKKHEYILKRERSLDYYKVFYTTLIDRKKEIFEYIQSYYRCFMGKKSEPYYPFFKY